jgi:putative tricarboxylic transport membrane protein
MRIAFLFVLLAGSVYYSYLAFADLGFMTRTGRLGPGFFPRIIGLTMCAFVIWSLVDAMRARTDGNRDTATWRDAVLLMALAIGYAVLLRLFGGFVATVIYLALTLSVLNSGKHLQNAILSILLPAGIYLLFDRLLNASMPPGLFELPI